MLLRVKKQDVQADTWVRPDPLEYCLAVWKDWMATTGQRNLGARIMGGLVGETDGHGQDLHEAQHSHDMQIPQSHRRWLAFRRCLDDQASAK